MKATKRFSAAPIATAVMLAMSATQATAEEAQEQEMETLVVVGKTTNTEITPEELDKYQANDLADIFRIIPSVSVGGSLGIAQKVYIRGLEDTLLNVTVDGAPQTGTLFHHIGRVSIDPELLKEVEVQAGAGEATSGFGAIGGAIRFKTKNVDDLLDEGEYVGGKVKANYFSNDGYKTSGSVYGRLNENWGILGSYVYSDRENMEDGDGNELFGTTTKQNLAFFKLNGELSDTQSLTFSYENREEEGEFGQRPNWPTLEGQTLYPMDAERETLVLNHSFNLNKLVNLETSIYSTESSVVQNVYDRWGRYQGKLKTVGFDIRNISEIGNHTLTYGVEYRSDEVTAKSLEADSTGETKEEGTVKGIYVQDHWQITDALLLSYGVRFDQYDLEQTTYGRETDSDGVSPNIGLNYSFNDNWQLNLGYAQAMRGKEVGDSFTIEASPDWVSIDPELDAEEVDNTEIGLIYQGENLHMTASVYKSEIDDVILDQLGQGTYYENVGTLETDGFELKVGYWYENLELVASYSNNDAELNGETVEGYEHVGLANARGDTWGLNLNYTLNDDVELGWNFTHVEDLNNIEVLHRAVEIGWIDETYEIDKDGYQVHDIYAQWQVNDGLLVNLTIQNLFDETYRDHSSVGDYGHVPDWDGVAGVNEAGRDIRLSVSYQF